MLTSRWIISYRCCWITVYVIFRNAQLNIIVVILSYMHCHALSIHQLPSCNLFTQHVSYLYGETPLVNCGPWSILLHLIIQPTAIIFLFHSLQLNIIFSTTLLILCFQQAGEIDTLTVTLGQTFLVVLCAGAVSSPTGSITLVFS